VLSNKCRLLAASLGAPTLPQHHDRFNVNFWISGVATRHQWILPYTDR
jgi:hypothetical protein